MWLVSDTTHFLTPRFSLFNGDNKHFAGSLHHNFTSSPTSLTPHPGQLGGNSVITILANDKAFALLNEVCKLRGIWRENTEEKPVPIVARGGLEGRERSQGRELEEK